jgi:hypothetical protein
MDTHETHPHPAPPECSADSPRTEAVRAGTGCDSIVVPIAFVAQDEVALAVARLIAREEGLPIHLVLVSSPNLDHTVDRQLLELQAKSLGDLPWTSEVLEGDDIVDRVTGWLHEHPRSLPVVASHARHALGRRVLGSVSEELLEDVHRPMVFVGPHAEVVDAAPMVLLHATVPGPGDRGTVDLGRMRHEARGPITVVEVGDVDDVVATIRSARSPVLVTPSGPRSRS